MTRAELVARIDGLNALAARLQQDILVLRAEVLTPPAADVSTPAVGPADLLDVAAGVARRRGRLTDEDVARVAHLSHEAAATELGVSPATISRARLARDVRGRQPSRVRSYQAKRCHWPGCEELFQPTGSRALYCPIHERRATRRDDTKADAEYEVVWNGGEGLTRGGGSGLHPHNLSRY